MGTINREQLPPDLVQGQRRFQAWWQQRKAGGRIPEALWAMAARLAKAQIAELLGCPVMLQIAPQMKILVAVRH